MTPEEEIASGLEAHANDPANAARADQLRTIAKALRVKAQAGTSVPQQTQFQAPPEPQKKEPGFFQRALATIHRGAHDIKVAGGDAVHDLGQDVKRGLGFQAEPPTPEFVRYARDRQLLRGIDRVTSAGYGQQFADWANRKLGRETAEQQARSEAETLKAAGPEYGELGELYGAAMPNWTDLLSKPFSKALNPVVNRAKGAVAGAVAKTAQNLVGYEASAVPLAAAQSAARGESAADAGHEMWRAASDPLALVMSGVHGAGTGAARGKATEIRDPGTLSGRVIKTVEANGGAIQPFGEPVRPVRPGSSYAHENMQGLPEGRMGKEELATREAEGFMARSADAARQNKVEFKDTFGDVVRDNAGREFRPREILAQLAARTKELTNQDGTPRGPHAEAELATIAKLRAGLSRQVVMAPEVPGNYEPSRPLTPMERQPHVMNTAESPELHGVVEFVRSFKAGKRGMKPPAMSDVVDAGKLVREDTQVAKKNPRYVGNAKTQVGRQVPGYSVEAPLVRVEDLQGMKDELRAGAEFGKPATPENRPYRLAWKALAKDMEQIDPRVKPMNERYGAVKAGLAEGNDLLLGQKKAEIQDRASARDVGARRLARVGKPTAGIEEVGRMSRLRDLSPANEGMVSRLEAREAADALRYGAPSNALENGSKGMVKRGISMMVGAALGAQRGVLPMLAGAAAGSGAEHYPQARVRVVLPAAERLARVRGERVPLGADVLTRTLAKRREKRKQSEQPNAR